MIQDYKLVGLSKGKRATLELLDTDRETFWTKIDMSDDRFEALWNYFGKDYTDVKIAEVQCDYVTKCGAPINGKVINIKHK